MMSTQTVSTQLFDLLVSRDFDPEMLDVSGRPAPNPATAELFSFDFRAESGKDYGTVVVMLGEDNNFEVYFGDNVGRTMEGQDKNDWFAFLHQLKNFAVKNFMSFSPKNINRLRYSMQGQAAIKEGLFESWTGTKTASWNGQPTEARLMIKHKKTIGEGDARFRYVESLFVETAEGERYKLPFTKLAGGRAMVEHVRNGGRPYDIRGQHIVEMVNEINVLSRFKRANQGKIFEGDTAQLVEQTTAYYETAQRTLKNLSTRKGYSAYFESWNPAEITEEEVVIEGLKHLFVTQSIDTRIESALPLLAKIQQQGTAMKEANIFEAWADRLVEGTWQTPDTPEKQAQLLELMSTDLPVGADATNATQQLYDVLGDDELFDQLEQLAERDANADARQVIYDRMQMLSDNPDVRKVIEQLNIDATAEMNPPEATNPADLEPMNESRLMDDTGETIEHILNRFKHEVKQFEQGGDLDEDLYHALFDYWNDAGEIPYGVQKARDGDPYEWVADNLQSHLSGGGIVGGNPDEDYGMERESVMHGDYAEEKSRIRELAGLAPEETDEGILGTVGGAMGGGMLGSMLGGAVGGPIGALAGAGIGQAAGAVGGQELTKGGSSIIEQGEEETDEGIVDTLKGLAGIKSAPKEPGGIFANRNPTVGQQHGPSTSIADLSNTLDTSISPTMPGFSNSMIEDEMEEGELGTAIGAGLGGAVGGIGGAALGGLAGHYLTKDKPKTPPLNVKPSSGPYKPNSQETDEGWKGQLAGRTLGTIAGGLAGAATPIPGGALVGGALGGTAGQMLGDKLGGNEEETDEGKLGALAGGAVGGYATKSVKGAVGGAKIGSALQDRFAKKDDSSPLAGQYGHSGKMKEVSKDTSFLDRLKELSGLKR